MKSHFILMAHMEQTNIQCHDRRRGNNQKYQQILSFIFGFEKQNTENADHRAILNATVNWMNCYLIS